MNQSIFNLLCAILESPSPVRTVLQPLWTARKGGKRKESRILLFVWITKRGDNVEKWWVSIGPFLLLTKSHHFGVIRWETTTLLSYNFLTLQRACWVECFKALNILQAWKSCVKNNIPCQFSFFVLDIPCRLLIIYFCTCIYITIPSPPLIIVCFCR